MKRGRKPKLKLDLDFDPKKVVMTYGSKLHFKEDIFQPLPTKSELDVILSTKGGVMPATNMVLVGGPGSGKTTIVLDMLSRLTRQGSKCLFISGEMDEIGYFKYCQRLKGIENVKVLFLKNYSDNIKQTLEYVFDQGFDVVGVDSIAEVIGMYKDLYKVPSGVAERWFLDLQYKHKLGANKGNCYTTFINIQQTTKSDEFLGSNRLKHMTDAMGHIEKNREGTERSIYFSKNRDCDKDFKMYFTISGFDGSVHYTYENI